MTEYLARIAVALAAPITTIILLTTVTLVLFTVARRGRRDRHFRRVDDIRGRSKPILTGLLAGRLNYRPVLASLMAVDGPRRSHLLEQLCLEEAPTAEQVPILRRLCEDLGLVKIWQGDLLGESKRSWRNWFSRSTVAPLSFLVRAKAAENLRLIKHQPSWPLLVKALDDPHPDVRSVALRALAAIVEPQSFPALVEKLRLVIEDPSRSCSWRAIKSVLVGFPLEVCPGLLPLLQHSLPRARFLATDVIRGMVEREAARNKDFTLRSEVFPTALADVFLDKLWKDVNPDVRARSALVIACLKDRRAAAALVVLLDDPQWFVRLHAIRALARPCHAELAEQIARRLTDSNWRVREAAAKTLVSLGEFDLLVDQLVDSTDLYAKEQIAEELERDGFMAKLLMRRAIEAGSRRKRVFEQLALLDKTNYIAALLRNGAAPMRHKFLAEFGQHPDPRVRTWTQRIAQA